MKLMGGEVWNLIANCGEKVLGIVLHVVRNQGCSEEAVDLRQLAQAPEGVHGPLPRTGKSPESVVKWCWAVQAYGNNRANPTVGHGARQVYSRITMLTGSREVKEGKVGQGRGQSVAELQIVGAQEDLPSGEVNPGEGRNLCQRLNQYRGWQLLTLTLPEAAEGASAIAAIGGANNGLEWTSVEP
jgi:hypothetical protein